MPFQSPAFQFPDALTKYNRWIETGVLNWWCPLRYIRDRYRRGLFSPRRSVTNAPKKVAGPTPPKVQFLVHREYSGNVKQTFYFPFSDFKKLFFIPYFLNMAMATYCSTDCIESLNFWPKSSDIIAVYFCLTITCLSRVGNQVYKIYM